MPPEQAALMPGQLQPQDPGIDTSMGLGAEMLNTPSIGVPNETPQAT